MSKEALLDVRHLTQQFHLTKKIKVKAVNEYGWWYITNGALDLNYTGMAVNEFGWSSMTKREME